MRRLVQRFRLAAGLFGDLPHSFHEGVQRALALRFGRLDHQRLPHDQREIVGRRMESEVHQALGDIERVHLWGIGKAPFYDELVHAAPVERHVISVAQLGQQIVGVEHRVVGDVPQAVPPVGADVGESPHVHAEVAVESLYPADRALRHH